MSKATIVFWMGSLLPLIFSLVSLGYRQSKRQWKSMKDTVGTVSFIGVYLLTLPLIAYFWSKSSVWPLMSLFLVLILFLITLSLGIWNITDAVDKNKQVLRENGLKQVFDWAKENGYVRQSGRDDVKSIHLINERFRCGLNHAWVTSEIVCKYLEVKGVWSHKVVLDGSIVNLPYQPKVSGNPPTIDRVKIALLESGEREVKRNTYRTDTRIVYKQVDRLWEKQRRVYINEFLSNLQGVEYGLTTTAHHGKVRPDRRRGIIYRMFGYKWKWVLKMESKTPPEKMVPYLQEQIELMYEIVRS